MWMIITGLWGCEPASSPEQVSALVLNNQLSQALPLIAAADADGPLADWKPAAQTLTDLGPQRRAIQQVEQGMLADAAEIALVEDRLTAALASIRAGLQSDPDHPTFQRLLQQVVDRAAQASPADAATLYAALAEIAPKDAPRYHLLHDQALLAGRYLPEHAQQTAQSQVGITLHAAHHLLDKLDQEYRIQPDWRAVSAAGHRQLVWLSTDPGARQQWPGLEGVAWPETTGADVGMAKDALRRAVERGTAAQIPPEPIIAEWIAGGLGALDPWTRAVWPAEIASWQAEHQGVRYGVGIELTEDENGIVRIARPLLDTPAWSSGVHQDDRLLAIQTDTRTVDLGTLPVGQRRPAAEQTLAGDAGTAVQIIVAREGTSAPMTFSLTRGPVKTQTLEGYQRTADNQWDLWLEPGLAYVRIRLFRDYSEPDFDALIEPFADRIQGMVLDLRGNPGGDVNAAVQIADRFIGEGLLAELSGRTTPETSGEAEPGVALVPWNQAIPGHPLEGVPVVVLVDRDTASAAEILAGSLQERADATIVGAPTWGKGMAQALRVESEAGYAIQFTNQVWTLPSGRQLARQLGGGVNPDLSAVLSPGEKYQTTILTDTRTALRVHADGTPMHGLTRAAREDLPGLSADPILVTGTLALKAKLTRSHPESR
ncbi:MAG: S41 family peptidase [Myxococcota bacterium]